MRVVRTYYTHAHMHTYFYILWPRELEVSEGGPGEGRGGEETVDRADFDGASRGEVRVEWLTLCPPGDPMDLKPMDAV